MEYKELAIDLAKKAGKIMRQNFSLGMVKQWKKDNSPVTKTDLSINELVIEEVKKYFPDHNVQGEEQSNVHSNSPYVWVCDPLDGTMPFSHGLPVFTFSLALVKNGVPILGTIYDPMNDRLFYAEKNKGAFLNNHNISVSNFNNIKNTCVDLTLWEDADYQIWPLNENLSRMHAKVFRLISVAYGSTLVASGEFTGSIFCGHTAHDIAAAKIIVEEAGGKVTDLFGNEQRYDQDIKGAIISNGEIHNFLVNEVNKLLSDGQ